MKNIVTYVVQEKINTELWIPKTSKTFSESNAVAAMKHHQSDSPDIELRVLKETIIQEVITVENKSRE